MKSFCKRLLSGLLVCCLLAGILPTASAVTPRASYYFACTEVDLNAIGGNTLIVEATADGTGRMDMIGVEEIEIYKIFDDGSYTKVQSFMASNRNGMMGYNDYSWYCSVSFTGESRCKYVALVYIYAERDGSGETIVRQTRVVTCVPELQNR